MKLKKTPDLEGFIGEFYQTCNKEIMPILHKLFQQTEQEGTSSFYEASFTLTLKLDKVITRKVQTSIFHDHIYKNSKQNFNTLIN